MNDAPQPRARSRVRSWMTGVLSIALVVGGLAGIALWTRPVRESVRVYTELISAANRGDVSAATRLCTARYQAGHPLRQASEGGIVGLPRNIHKNFQAWRHGESVWLCPTNRVGPIYQFVREPAGWRFDGPVGILRGRGEVVLMPEGMPDEDEP